MEASIRGLKEEVLLFQADDGHDAQMGTAAEIEEQWLALRPSLFTTIEDQFPDNAGGAVPSTRSIADIWTSAGSSLAATAC